MSISQLHFLFCSGRQCNHNQCAVSVLISLAPCFSHLISGALQLMKYRLHTSLLTRNIFYTVQSGWCAECRGRGGDKRSKCVFALFSNYCHDRISPAASPGPWSSIYNSPPPVNISICSAGTCTTVYYLTPDC